jgi:hypothetical protein
MTCEEIRELLEMYSLGVLEPEQDVEIAEHLGTNCAICVPNLRQANHLNAAVLMAAADAEPSPELRNRILGMVRPVAVRRPARWPLALTGLAAAAMAAGLLFFAIDSREKTTELARMREQRDAIDREYVRLNAAFSFLRDPQTRPANATGAPTQPRGTYFISPRGVLLIASQLPTISAGQTYQMWVIPRGQSPSSAGLFRPDNNGAAVHFYGEPVNVPSAQALAISVEPVSGSAAPTTTPLLVTPVSGA